MLLVFLFNRSPAATAQAPMMQPAFRMTERASVSESPTWNATPQRGSSRTSSAWGPVRHLRLAACSAFVADRDVQAIELLQSYRCVWYALHGRFMGNKIDRVIDSAGPFSDSTAGLPFAIELAAKLSTETPEEVAQEMVSAVGELRACEATEPSSACGDGQICVDDERCNMLLWACDEANGVYRFDCAPTLSVC